MGISILELVLQILREADFSADVAFPGQEYPYITEPVAAVHIEKVDRASLTVTVEVSIVSPAALGGTRCEAEALRATEVLTGNGAVCIQSGCSYDGVAQVYTVSIMAAFTGVAGAENCTLGPGFQVFVQDSPVPWAVAFEAEQVRECLALYEMGENAPMGICGGSWIWKLRLEELIPAGNPEPTEPEEPFLIRLDRDTGTEIYENCRWSSVRREYSRQGLRRIRSGISMRRQEVSVGQTGL